MTGIAVGDLLRPRSEHNATDRVWLIALASPLDFVVLGEKAKANQAANTFAVTGRGG